MRCAASATGWSWVTSRMVWPPSCRRRNSSSTSSPPSESRAPVGSSARTHGGLVGQRPGDGEPLALTTGQHAGRLLGLVADAEQVEQVARPGLGRLALAAGDHRGHHHVLQDGHALEEVEELEHDADVPAPHDGQLVLVHAGQPFAGDRAPRPRRGRRGRRRCSAASTSRSPTGPSPRRTRPARRRGRRPAGRGTGAASCSNVRYTPSTFDRSVDRRAGAGVVVGLGHVMLLLLVFRRGQQRRSGRRRPARLDP